jgi:hypothetical protein
MHEKRSAQDNLTSMHMIQNTSTYFVNPVLRHWVFCANAPSTFPLTELKAILRAKYRTNFEDRKIQAITTSATIEPQEDTRSPRQVTDYIVLGILEEALSRTDVDVTLSFPAIYD